MYDDQQRQTAARAIQETTASACPHPEAAGQRWGDPISLKRQAELQGYLDQWRMETDHGNRKGPFDKGPSTFGVPLTGADVCWLARQAEEPPVVQGAPGSLSELHLEGADLRHAHLEGAVLYEAHLEAAGLFEAHLEGAKLPQAHLECADLGGAHLVGTSFYEAKLMRASLRGAYLEGADFRGAQLEGTDLREGWLDTKTQLTNVTLDQNTLLGDIQWGGVGSVNLTRINWEHVPTIGDEHLQRVVDLGDPHGVGRRARLRRNEDAVRAYRQLAVQLRAQGMNEVADRFAYRSQVLQRRVFLSRFRILQYLGSRFLDLISGYGHRPMRSFLTYLLVVSGFAAAYYFISLLLLSPTPGPVLSPLDAVVFSMTSFHGRGFVPNESIGLSNPLTIVAAIEAFAGLLIEIIFIATFTQRFFAR